MIRPRVFQFAVPYRRSAWVLIILDCHFQTVGRRKFLFINNGFALVLFLSCCDRLRPAASIFTMVLSLLLPSSTTTFNVSTQGVEANLRVPRVNVSTQDMKLEGLLPVPSAGSKPSNRFHSFDPILKLRGLPTTPSSSSPFSSSLVIARPSDSQYGQRDPEDLFQSEFTVRAGRYRNSPHGRSGMNTRDHQRDHEVVCVENWRSVGEISR